MYQVCVDAYAYPLNSLTQMYNTNGTNTYEQDRQDVESTRPNGKQPN